MKAERLGGLRHRVIRFPACRDVGPISRVIDPKKDRADKDKCDHDNGTAADGKKAAEPQRLARMERFENGPGGFRANLHSSERFQDFELARSLQ
jgi:hypothetical protein